jgi:hypothetical protein
LHVGGFEHYRVAIPSGLPGFPIHLSQRWAELLNGYFLAELKIVAFNVGNRPDIGSRSRFW